MDAVVPILYILSFIAALAYMCKDMKEWEENGEHIDQKTMEEQRRDISKR